MKIILWLLVLMLVLLVTAWIGLRIKPASFAAPALMAGALKTMPLPDGLPPPVARFYRELYGDQVPVVQSAVFSGRATMRVNGLTFPARFRFTHDAGKSYRHYIEATFFGLPLLKVNEHYVDGVSRMALPFGVTEDEPKVNQAANLALWGEALWFPTLWLNDPRVRWEAVDDVTALLFMPYGEAEEQFLVRFDGQTGRIHILEAMRYKGAESPQKTLWLNEASEWAAVNGQLMARTGAVTWFDEGRPWAEFIVEDVLFNAAVEEYVRATGP